MNKRMQTFQATAALLVLYTTLTVLIFSAAGCSGVYRQASLVTSEEEAPNQEISQPWPTPDPDAMIQPDGLKAFDNFGTALAYDDNLLAVGAPNTDLEGARNAGAVYIFQKKGGEWQQLDQLTAQAPQPDARFGSTLAIDADVLVIGAPYEYNPVAGNASGAAYVFTRRGRAWAKAARLSAQDGVPFDLFGSAIALHGRDLAIGARAADSLYGRDTGAVYVYQQDGRNWLLQTRLGADARAFDHFGQAVAFAGEELLVGAPDTDLDQAANAGMVFVYRRTGSSQPGWTEHTRITAAEPRPQARFGAALSVQDDLIAVLATQEYQKPGSMPSNAAAYESTFGAAHLFERDGDQWRWLARLIPESPGGDESAMVSSMLLADVGSQTRLALTGYGSRRLNSFEQQDGEWQPRPSRDLPEFGLMSGMALLAVDGQILMGDCFYDIAQANGEAIQAAGVIWILDW